MLKDKAEVLLALLTSYIRRRPIDDLRLPWTVSLNDAAARLAFSHKIEGLYDRVVGVETVAGVTAQRIWEHQRAALADIGAAARQASMRIVVMKGAAHTEALHGGRSIGRRGDIDLLIDEGDRKRWKEIFLELGFRPARFDTRTGNLLVLTDEQVAQVEREDGVQLAKMAKVFDFEADEELTSFWPGWEHPLLVKASLSRLVIAANLHLRLVPGVSAAEVMDRSVAGPFPDTMTLSWADHLWYGISMYYFDISLRHKKKLTPLCDLTCIVQQHGSCIDFDNLVKIARFYRSGPAHFYLLSLVKMLVGCKGFPEWRLENLLDGDDRSFDFGWQVTKLMGLVDSPAILMQSLGEADADIHLT